MGEFSDKDMGFILNCLACDRDGLNIDFHQAAAKNGISQARNCQQKFKKLIESTKRYALINGKVTDLEDPNNANAAPATPNKPGRKAASTPRTGASTGGRKRKAAKEATDDEQDSNVEEETPAKKKRTPGPKRGAAKKAAAKVKKEADEEEKEQEEDAADDDVEEVNGGAVDEADSAVKTKEDADAAASDKNED